MLEWIKDHLGWTILIGFLLLCLIIEGCVSSNNDKETLIGYSKYRIKISVKMDTYAGVGTNFEWQFRVNNIIVENGDTIDAQTPLSCFAKVVEEDSYRYPDVGMNTVTIDPKETNEAMVIVRVDEYGGVDNYGAFAVFIVYFTFTGYN